MTKAVPEQRSVLTPSGRRIVCRDASEFTRVTRWVAWIKARQAERNTKESSASC